MARKQKILYVEMAHGLGGSVVSLYQLVRGLDRSRYDPIVLFYWDNPYVGRFRQLGLETIVWAGPRKKGDAMVPLSPPLLVSGRYRGWLEKFPWMEGFYHGLGLVLRTIFQTLPLAWRVRRIIRSRGVDLVHANDLVGCNREVILAARLSGRPCICHIRAFERYTALDRFLIQFVDRFIFISQAIASSCISQGVDPMRGTVVYNALDATEFFQAFDDGSGRERLGLRPDDRVVGIIGRLVPWKGHEVFLRAMAQVAASMPHLKCLIIGDAESGDEEQGSRRYRAELEDLVRELGLADRVKFLGWRGDVPQLLSTMDLLVHSSIEPEPFGRVIIEGMAAGKPVVAVAAGACPELIENGVSGLLVPPGDADALAEAVKTLLQDPDRMRAMGIVARRQVENRFSIAEHVRRIEQIYDSFMNFNK